MDNPEMKKAANATSNSLEVVIAKSVGEVEAIRPVWEEMQNNEPYPIINADIDRYLSVVLASGEQVQPYVVLTKKSGHPVAMAICRLQKWSLKLKLGYKTLFSSTLRCLGVVYGGVIGNLTNDVCEMLVRELMNTLRCGEADMIRFNHIRTDSCIFRISIKLPGVLNRGYFPKVENHWSMSAPENLEQFYQARSKKHRGNLKRYISKLDKEYPNQVRIITYTEEGDLDEAIKAASQISRLTYQHGLDSGFTDNPRTRVLLTTAARQGWLRMSVLYINGEPGAFQVGQHYGKQYMLEQIGFDPKWSRLELGTVLFIRVLEDICADPDIEFVDFGFGDADYKHSYGDKQWQEASVYIFAPRLYPIFINIVQTFTIGLNKSLEYILHKTGLVGWIKRRWRDLLQVRSVDKRR
jgi:hypothetical protein